MSVTMPTDTLREKLEKLVEEWRAVLTKSDQTFGFRTLSAASVSDCIDQLAAILAESEEPEPREPRQFRTGGKKWDLPAGQTHYVGDDCEGGHAEVGEILPMYAGGSGPVRLPLGHEFVGHSNGSRTLRCQHITDYDWLCGQPRSAHEPKP